MACKIRQNSAIPTKKKKTSLNEREVIKRREFKQLLEQACAPCDSHSLLAPFHGRQHRFGNGHLSPALSLLPTADCVARRHCLQVCPKPALSPQVLIPPTLPPARLRHSELEQHPSEQQTAHPSSARRSGIALAEKTAADGQSCAEGTDGLNPGYSVARPRICSSSGCHCGCSAFLQAGPERPEPEHPARRNPTGLATASPQNHP